MNIALRNMCSTTEKRRPLSAQIWFGILPLQIGNGCFDGKDVEVSHDQLQRDVLCKINPIVVIMEIAESDC